MSNHGCDCCYGCKEKEITPRMVKFEQAGSCEWKVPKNSWYRITITGAGGAGGNAVITSCPVNGTISVVGGSGGAGGTAIKSIYLLKDTVIPITVGAGGKNTRQIPSDGHIILIPEESGETSFFGNYCSATGGTAGESVANHVSMSRRTGQGGIGINGDLNIVGGRAFTQCCENINGNLEFFSPGCSPSIYGAKGYGMYSGCDGISGEFGSGGEGAIAQDNKEINSVVNHPFYGGDGGDGVVIIEWTEVQ